MVPDCPGNIGGKLQNIWLYNHYVIHMKVIQILLNVIKRIKTLNGILSIISQI